MRVNQDGSRQLHGARRDCSYTSATYRRLCRRIVERMAQEFGSRPGVIGWQTDNEFLLTPDFSEETIRAWRAWLKQRYGTIAELNRRWGTELWSQTYTSFDRVPAPVDRVNHHLSLRFNWLRFTNEQIAAFQAEQIAAIRKYSKLPIAHDTMANQPVDYELLHADLDYMGFNTYHDYEFYWRIAGNYDRMRGFGKGMHWLFETAPNYSGGTTARFIHSPVGGVRAALWMNHALGGQASLFWLWRQHRTGQEMTHGSVISAWGKPAANYDALRQIGEEIQKTSDFLMNAPVAPAQVAILYSCDSAVGLEIEPYVAGLQYYVDWSARFYRPLQDAYLHRDVIMPGHDLSGYRLIFAPLVPYLPARTRARMKSWVEAGGALVLGPMSGYRDEEWTAFTDYALGDIESWSGIEVDARLPIGGTPKPPLPIKLLWRDAGAEHEGTADLWQETLSSKSGRVLARYGNGLADGRPAIIEASVGKGRVVILGTDPGPEDLRRLLLRLAGEVGIKPVAQGDAGAIVSPRAGANSHGWVVVNVSGTAKKIALDGIGVDLISGREKPRNLELAPYDVVVIKRSGSR
jgi:beta-galactosidase GanA